MRIMRRFNFSEQVRKIKTCVALGIQCLAAVLLAPLMGFTAGTGPVGSADGPQVTKEAPAETVAKEVEREAPGLVVESEPTEEASVQGTASAREPAAKSKKTGAQKASSSKQYMLSFNQLVALPARQQHNYLVQLQTHFGELHSALRGPAKGAKTGSLMNFWATPAWAQAAPSSEPKFCLDLGYIRKDDECNGPRDTNETAYDNTFADQIFPGASECFSPQQRCNPVIFGPGICVEGNDTNKCTRAALRAENPSGISGLREALQKCKTSPDSAYMKACQGLQDEINATARATGEVCEWASAGKRSVTIICERMALAVKQLRNEGLLIEARNPSTCNWVGPNRVLENCKGSSGGGYCVGVVRNCPAPLDIQGNEIYEFRGQGLVVCGLKDGKCPVDANLCVEEHLKSATPAKKVKEQGPTMPWDLTTQ